jgi:ABC-2 type transport system permease protein
MNTLAVARHRSAVDDGRWTGRVAPILPMLLAQTRSQLRVFWRLPSVSATALVMPLMLFAFFVLPHAHDPYQGPVSLGASMLASIGAYAVGSVMVFNYGVTLALDRGQKIDLLARAAPLPGWVFLLARALSALAYGTLALFLLFAVAAFAGGITLEPATWLALGVRLLVGSLPFIALGFAIAYLATPSAAPAVANLLFVGMAFASGMLVPLDQMPDVVRAAAPLLPTYHYAQLALDTLGPVQQSAATSGLWLLAFSTGLFGLAAIAYRRESRRKFA